MSDWIADVCSSALDPLGYGALVLAAMTWAVYTVRFRSSRLSALQSAALICFWSAVIFIPVYVGWNLSRLSQASSREIVFQFVYQGVLMSGVALFAYNRAVAVLGAGAAAAMRALVPRAEGSRVGKDGVSTCRPRWAADD